MTDWQMAGEVDGLASLFVRAGPPSARGGPPAVPPPKTTFAASRMPQDAARGRDWPAFYFSSSGRVARGEFWLFGYLPVVVAMMLLVWIPVVGWVSFIAGQWSLIALSFKRFHDRGLSGWWGFVSFLPFIAGSILLASAFFSGNSNDHGVGAVLLVVAGVIGIGQLILVYLRAGMPGPNRYGPDPLGNSE